MNEVLIETMITKIEKHEKQILQIERNFENQPGQIELISELKSTLEELKTTIQGIAFATEEMRELSGNLRITSTLLKQPVKQKVLHHHHMNKALWTLAILFNVVVILAVRLSNASDQIDENRGSDIKYRHLKLNNDRNLHRILQLTDSLYFINPARMRKDVIQEEERRKERFELIQQAEEKENDARHLKEKARNN